MKWILMIYLGSTGSSGSGQSGFSAEFNDLQSCRSAYVLYVKNSRKLVRSTTAGVCVPKGAENAHL